MCKKSCQKVLTHINVNLSMLLSGKANTILKQTDDKKPEVMHIALTHTQSNPLPKHTLT